MGLLSLKYFESVHTIFPFKKMFFVFPTTQTSKMNHRVTQMSATQNVHPDNNKNPYGLKGNESVLNLHLCCFQSQRQTICTAPTYFNRVRPIYITGLNPISTKYLLGSFNFFETSKKPPPGAMKLHFFQLNQWLMNSGQFSQLCWPIYTQEFILTQDFFSSSSSISSSFLFFFF